MTIRFICDFNYSWYRLIHSGVNFLDIMVRQGLVDHPTKPPFIMGSECAGKVVAIGEDVKQYKVRRSVFFSHLVITSFTLSFVLIVIVLRKPLFGTSVLLITVARIDFQLRMVNTDKRFIMILSTVAISDVLIHHENNLFYSQCEEIK